MEEIEANASTGERWPSLRLSDWEPTYTTLHRFLQVIGKVRLALAPFTNHWWNVPFYVTTEGLTTSPIPLDRGALTVRFDLRTHQVLFDRSDGRHAELPLEPMTVRDFYQRTREALRALDVAVSIWPVPVEVVDRTPFDRDTHHASYDRAAVERLHRVLVSLECVFERFRAGFIGKTSPVHLFWGAFDLAVSRFSGRRNPAAPDDKVMGPAYSHEVISHGFWPGGDWPGVGRVEDALLYAYAVPEPPGFATAEVAPRSAYYDEQLHEFVLHYETVRHARDPEREILRFLDTTYTAAATRAGWPIEQLEVGACLTHPHVRSAKEVFDDHLALAQARRFEDDIRRNFDAHCTLFAKGKIFHGHDGVRELARMLDRELPKATFDYGTRLVEDDVCFLEWSAEDENASVRDGADTFVVRDGKVVSQTIHYTLSR